MGMGALVALRELQAKARTLETAYVNGHVWTGRAETPVATAFGTIGARLAAVGADREVRALAGRRTRIVDLEGAFVTPGFIDSHTHFVRAAITLDQPDLRDAKSRGEFVSRLADAARKVPAGSWLQGGYWDEQIWGGELPSRAWIDPVTSDTPVLVSRVDLHLVLANSLALRLAGIDRNTPDPEGGLIVRDPNGEPTGLLKEKARDLIKPVIPPPSDAQVDAALGRAITYARSKGITQVHVTEVDWTTQDALRRLPVGENPGLRFYSMVPIESWQRLADLIAKQGRGDDWIRWGGVKGLIDGSLGSRTALFREPYADDPSNRGLRRVPLDELREQVLAADAAGLQIALHAIGDAANEDALDLFEAAAKRNAARDRRFRIEHAQHLRSQDVPRFARQNVIASMQPYHAIDDSRWAASRLGKNRMHFSWALRSLLDTKAHIAFGSDWPVAPIDPLLGVEAAVLRRTIDGSHPEGWVPEQRITVQEALTAYTLGNAYAGFQEDRLGVIAPGYLADVTVLDTNLTTSPPERISKAKILRTLVGGTQR